MTSINTTVDYLRECKLALLVRKDEKMFETDYVLLSRGTYEEQLRRLKALEEKVTRLLLKPGAPGSLAGVLPVQEGNAGLVAPAPASVVGTLVKSETVERP